tara:strand:+ start:3348 stop:4463 length:1116 start_codon:yes stop_codon:yes gene_type:complete
MKAGLDAAERMARLRLARSAFVGPATFRDLLQNMPDSVSALDALPELARRGNIKGKLRIASEDEIVQETVALASIGARLIVFGDAEYPMPLAMIDPPPPAISVMGDMRLLNKRALAVVGSRNASAAGVRVASDISRDLGQNGFAVVSGLARGIDAAAHRAALATGTIAVLGGGIDVVYPEENRALQKEIGERGLLIAEMPLGTEPRANLFPRRNRLISGLSLGVVVVEAALRSGSLITARFALEQDREVFAVPGSPLDPRTRGSNSLIKQGAPLVENAEDILASIDAPTMRRLLEPAPQDYAAPKIRADDIDDSARHRVLSALGPTPVLKDEIIRQTGLSAAEVAVILIELTLANRVSRDAGDRVSLLPGD